MSDEDVPTPVFEGPFAEVMFVQSLIESAGIPTTVTDLMRGGRVGFYPKIFVRRADAEHAMEIVDDFRKNGHRTAY
jgi:hypothetical protein